VRWALRRILWIVPTLALISVAAFWALSFGVEGSHRLDLLDSHDPGDALPRFFNPEPRGIRERAATVVESVARQDAQSERARAELVRLGGAALPHVLPQLDALDPFARGRVALALAPIAERMRIGSREELSDPESAVVFWARFWEDRAIDFRPAVVKRAVRRLARDETPGRLDDIRQLDTFALSELISEMGPVESPSDLVRARRLAAAAAEVTGLSLTISEGASVEQGAELVHAWQRWWIENRADYVTLEGARRLLAMFTETHYGRWATEAFRNRLGTAASGEPVLDAIWVRAPVTLWLLAAGLLAGYAAGIALGVVSGVVARRPLDTLLSIPTVALAALPIAPLAVWLAPAMPGAGSTRAALLMTAISAALVARHQRSATRVALDQDYTRTARAFGASRLRIASRGLRASSAAVVSLLGVDLPALITAAFVIEHAFELPGLGPATLAAVGSRDVAWLMAITLASAASVALAQVASDALLAGIDPRVRVALARKRGAVE
jgi:peptide/nickel transport system permease protein